MKQLNYLTTLLVLFIFSSTITAQTVIGFEDFDGNEINLSGSTNVANYGSGGGAGGDVFGRVNGQAGGIGMPFDVADDTAYNVSGGGAGSNFPADQLGIAGQNTTAFFALNDMDAVGVNDAVWTFSGWGDAVINSITIDLAAMGNFETASSDGFIIEAAVNGGAFQEIFRAVTNEAETKTYRPLDGGFVLTTDDPLELFIDGNLTAEGFLDKCDVVTGNFDTYTSQLLNGETASEIQIKLRWEGAPSGSEPMGIDNITINGTPIVSTPELVISEIMYNPLSSEDDWEWIEVYNAGATAVDLAGFVIDDNNGAAHSSANIAGGIIAAGASAVFFNADDITETDFAAAWGDVALIPVTNWGAMTLNNGGDTIAIWESFAAYTGDHQTQLNAIEQVAYDDSNGWPSDNNAGSIYLTDLTADNTDGANWALSTDGASTPLFTAYTSNAAAGNSGADVGSPGVPASSIKPLLITEIAVTPTAGEFIEIYNPNATSVDLSNVYLTDATFAGGSTYYYNIVTGSNAGGGGFGDFLARFPDGATIAPEEYITIAITGSEDFFATYGVNPDYELYEDNATADAIPDMREGLAGSINNQGSLTNGGEVAILFYWDGTTDLVTDLDYVIWGDTAEAVDKTGVTIDGPDADNIGSTYNNDTPIASQQLVSTSAHSVGESFQRQDLLEGAEITSGGNGANGHDETSEDLMNTWCSSATTPGQANTCGTAPTTLYKISEVQGASTSSPLVNQSVKVSAIVTATFQGTNQIGGFFIQEEDVDMDADSNTSEGVFVYCNSCPDLVTVGDLVEVTGTVKEFFGMTQIDVTVPNSLITVVSSGNPLPTPTDITLPAADSTSAEATFESVEGMIVNVTTPLVVSEYFELARYGTLMLTANEREFQFTHTNTPDPTNYTAFLEDLGKKRILLDDDSNIQNNATAGPVDQPYFWPRPGLSNSNYIRGGDQISNLKGIMHWSFSGQNGTDAWRIRPVVDAFDYNFTSENPRVSEPEEVGGTFKVASFNVLNYFTTLNQRGAHSQVELERQRAKIAAAICALNADVVGLIEIENNGTVALNDLLNGTGGINDVCGSDYVAVDAGVIGGDQIAVAFIYNAATTSLAGAHAILDSSVDPRFLDSKNRPALAQTFEEIATGGKITIAVNHFKSKGSSCNDVGDPNLNDGSGNCNGTRTDAAAALVDWLATDPTNSGDTDFLILGDLNSYKSETPISAILAGADDTPGTGDDYTDLLAHFVGANAYGYVFNGQLGYLDYALANADLLTQVTGATSWNINADEINLFDYNDGVQDPGEASFHRESNALPIYEPNMFRASDHDPVLVGLNLVTANNAPVIDCPANISTNVDAGSCSAIVVFPDATATDVDGDLQTVEQTNGLTSGSAFPVGETVIEFTATDSNGNTAVCTFTITVIDNEAPQIDCPADFTVDTGVGNTQYEVPDFFATGVATANDNCTDPVTIYTQNPAEGELLDDGVYEVILTAEDEYGNISDCSFNLTVESVLGVSENLLENAVRIFPNPAKTEVTIAKSSDISLESATVFDITGRVIMTVNLKAMNQEKTIDISKFQSGIYLIKLESANATLTKQLLKK